MVTFVNSNRNNRYHKLTGYAGTGKSYLIVQFIKYLQAKKQNIIVASPTNKAAKNINTLAQKANLAIDSTTLAKLLSLLPEINEIKGNEIFVSFEPDKQLNYDVIFVDEYSMVSSDNLKLLNQMIKASDKNPKVIFIGDSAQLPPIGEKEPPVDNYSSFKSFSELSEIVRYDGVIAQIAEQIRSNPLYNQKIFPFVTTSDNSIRCLPRSAWGKQACEFMVTEEFKKDTNFARILVFRNNTAARINNLVRNYLFGQDCKSFEISDLLIAKTPVFRLAVNTKNLKMEWSILMNNSEECKVVDEATLNNKEITLFNQTYNFDYWSVPVLTDGGVHLDLQILTESSQLEIEKIKPQVKQYIQNSQRGKKELWEKYQVLEKTFDNCPFAYAITTHKAQGSSINNVFIDVADILGCGDLQKIQYTAFTRAIDTVWIPV